MTDYERSGQPWKDDPATEVIGAYYADISEELGTDGPAETFGNAENARVGHLVEAEDLDVSDGFDDVLAVDTHDTVGLSSEELAMHYVDESASEDEDDLPEELRAALAE